MTTEAQVAANRLNAQKSTGPRTPEGKAAVALNAVTHGLRAQAIVLPGEDGQEYTRYQEQMREQLQPEELQEIELTERIIGLSWRLRRAGRYHDAVFEALYEQEAAEMAEAGLQADGRVLGRMLVTDFSGPRVLERVQLYERRIETSLARAWAQWRELQGQPRTSEKGPSLSVGGTGNIPAASTPDGVTTNRPGTADGKGGPPAAGKHVLLGQPSQRDRQTLSDLGLGGTNKANFGEPIDVLGALADHKRLPRRCTV